jgi:serine/threonine-protein kinase RsbT
MLLERAEVHPVRNDEDVVRARRLVRDASIRLGFSLVEQTKIVTAASELARNTMIHGGGGTMTLETLRNGVRVGLALVFEDHGPGIADLEAALRGGHSTGTGLGLGLSGSKRLMSEFDVDSRPGEGTRVRVVRWK